MLKPARIGLVCALALLVGASMAAAQSSLGIGTAEPSFDISGPFGPFLAFVNREQQGFYRALTGALSAMRDDPWKLWTLVGLSFAYGVFHAAGPGHGKAVISSYMLANELELNRGVLLSFLSSILQGLVANLLDGAAYLFLRGTTVSMTDATRALEIGSYALIALFGAWLLYKKLRPAPVRPASGVWAMSFGGGG